MPQARYAFIGDTARLPYGSKSRRTIARYAAQSAQFLVREQGAEFLVIACNTASALALDAIKEAVPDPVLGVIEPGAEAARAASHTGDVLVIATDATVQSHAYLAACKQRGLRTMRRRAPCLCRWLKKDGSIIPSPPRSSRLSQRASLRSRRAWLQGRYAGARMHALSAVAQCCLNTPSGPASGSSILRSPLRKPQSSSLTAALEAARHDAATRPKQTEVRCFATDSVEKFERLGSRFLGRPWAT